MNRRDFFKIVATTGATAAVAGCQPATEQILPLVIPNEHLIPGVAAWFATVCRACPGGCGVLAKVDRPPPVVSSVDDVPTRLCLLPSTSLDGVRIVSGSRPGR